MQNNTWIDLWNECAAPILDECSGEHASLAELFNCADCSTTLDKMGTEDKVSQTGE
jgi:hypothetical protein